jgi:hypothetical protein
LGKRSEGCFAEEKLSLSYPTWLPQKSTLKATFQQLSRVGGPQLPHHAGAVRFDGFLADSQLRSNLPVLETLPDETDYLLLPSRQGDSSISAFLGFHKHRPSLDGEDS